MAEVIEHGLTPDGQGASSASEIPLADSYLMPLTKYMLILRFSETKALEKCFSF